MNASYRNKSSIFNALSAMMLTLVNGLLGIIVTRMIINQYGSDFNGLNSTANQIVNVLLIVEGGFALASNVALFSPLTANDYEQVNDLLFMTQRKFKKIGLLFLILGLIASIGFTFFANSSLPYELIFTVIMMTMVPAAFNLYYATTYRVLLQTQQKEYIINLFTMLTLGMGHLGNIVLVLIDGSIWLVRVITMVTALLNSALISWYVKRKNPFISLKGDRKDVMIKGTKDVMVQKITGMIYNSAPIIFLAISPTGGTVLASVYAVYNNVFNMIKSLLRSIIDAPRLGIGQMLSESSREDVWKVFSQYEYIVFSAIFVTINTSFVLIMPFIAIYTKGISDANYFDTTIASLMTLIAVFELVHIPSGHLMNMAGEFKVSKNIQLVSCIVLVICMVFMGEIWGIHGLLYAVLIVSLLLAILEIGYVHLFFFKGRLKEFFTLFSPLFFFGIASCIFENKIFNNISSITDFIFHAMLVLFINVLFAVGIGFFFNRKTFMYVLSRAIGIVSKKQTRRS